MTDLITQETKDELIVRLRKILADSGGAQFPSSPESLERPLFAAIRDVERHIPKQEIYEIEITERAQTSQRLTPQLTSSAPFPALLYIKDWEQKYGADEDTATAYDYYKPIRPFTERVWTADADGSNASSYYTRGTDYLINYISGAIYIPSSGSSIPEGEDKYLYISYEVDINIIDLAPLFKLKGRDTEEGLNPIRVTNVEYPIGATPQRYIDFDVWGDLLFIHWPEAKGTSTLKKHIAIHYETDQWITSGGYSAPAQDIYNLLEDLYGGLFGDIDFGFGDMYTGIQPKDVYKDMFRKSIADICRHIPAQLIRDYVIDLQIDDEQFSLGAEDLRYDDTGRFHQLGEDYNVPWKAIEPFSEEVWSGASKTGTRYVRGTDYEMDYQNGRIGWWTKNTVVNDTSMSLSTTYYISYRRSPRTIDISDITRLSGTYQEDEDEIREHLRNGFIRITEVEYPAGQVPRRFVPFNVWGDNLQIQDKVFDERLLRVYYEGCYVLPDWVVEELIWPGEKGFRVVYLAGDAGESDTPFVLYTLNIGADTPTWVDITGGLTTTGTGRTHKFILDPWNPGRGWMLTEQKAEYNSGLRTGGTWSVKFDKDALEALTGVSFSYYKQVDIQGTVRTEGSFWMLILTDHPDNPGYRTIYVVYTTDFGETWNYTNIVPTGYSYSSYFSCPNDMADLEVSQLTNDVWVSAWNGITPQGRIFRSTDGAGTFDNGSVILTYLEAAPYAPIYLYQPYHDNEDGLKLWVYGTSAQFSANIKYSTNGGATWTDRHDGVLEAVVNPASRANDMLTTFPTDSQKAMTCNEEAGENIPGTLFRSSDGFTNYTEKTVPTSGQVIRALSISIVPGNWDHILVGVDAAEGSYELLVWRSTDGGDSFLDKTGNSKTLLDARYAPDPSDKNHYPITIVPDWTT